MRFFRALNDPVPENHLIPKYRGFDPRDGLLRVSRVCVCDATSPAGVVTVRQSTEGSITAPHYEGTHSLMSPSTRAVRCARDNSCGNIYYCCTTPRELHTGMDTDLWEWAGDHGVSEDTNMLMPYM